MERRLSYALHVLTARLDRIGDRMLRAEHDVSYSRFLALTLVGHLGAPTQRQLAEALGITEPSVSRMVGVLAADGLLSVEPDPEGGRRRRLGLTAAGRELIDGIQQRYEERLAVLVERSGVPYEEYAAHTQRLLDTLDRWERENPT